jgi:hypothetical protein
MDGNYDVISARPSSLLIYSDETKAFESEVQRRILNNEGAKLMLRI